MGLQQAAPKTAGCHRIFTDHGVNGTRASRPELDKVLDHLREGDEVVVWKLDRLGRNTRNLLALIDDWRAAASTSAASRKGSAQRGRWAGRGSPSVGRAGQGRHGPGRGIRTNGRAAGGHRRPYKGQACPRAESSRANACDIGKIIGSSQASVCRYLRMESTKAG